MPRPGIRACLITNPRSGRGGVDLSTVLPILHEHGWDVIIRQKLQGGMATAMARQAAKDGYQVVVNCGGDGTLREIVNGVIGTPTAVGVLPGGTVNLWTKEIGISPRLDEAARQLVKAVPRRVDAGRVTINGGHGRHFLLMAGLGLDGAVMARVSKPLKNRIGTLAVGLAVVRSLPSFDPVPVHIEMGETQWQGRTGQIIVGNTRLYGGFTRFTPHAYIDDGLLDVCVVTSAAPMALVRQTTSLLLRRHPDLQSAAVYRAGEVTIRSPRILPLQLDGGRVKLKDTPPEGGMIYAFSVIARGLTVLVPETYRGDLFQHGMGAQAGMVSPGTHPGEEELAHPKRQLRVIEVGTETFTAARVRDGRVFTVLLMPETGIKDAAGNDLDRVDFLASLKVGDVLQVKGAKDRERSTIEAKKIKVPAAQQEH